MIDEIGQAIRDYSAMGFECIPVQIVKAQSGKKRLDFNGLKWRKDITRRMSLLALSRLAERANGLCIKTGRKFGITVVDGDTRGQTDGAKVLSAIIAGNVPKVETPNGVHYWFSYVPELHTATNNAVHIDVRNDGGIVIAPPSAVSDKRYRWVVPLAGEAPLMPDMLIDMLLQMQVAKQNNERPAKRSSIAGKAKRLSEMSYKQRLFLDANIKKCAKARVGYRSERDFYLCIFSIKARLYIEDLWHLCMNIGKFKQEGRTYFDYTYSNALQKAKVKKG